MNWLQAVKAIDVCLVESNLMANSKSALVFKEEYINILRVSNANKKLQIRLMTEENFFECNIWKRNDTSKIIVVRPHFNSKYNSETLSNWI